jgi:spoIIIJ-associated protein
VEEAIQKALEKLGVSREEVEVTVVKEGRHGILGLGAGEAKVLVRPLVAMPDKPEKTKKTKKPEKTKKPDKPEKTKKPDKPKKPEKTEEPGEEGDVAEAAKGVLEALLDRLGLAASIVSEVKPPLGGEGAPVVSLNVKGDDLGILIGRRGQTLASLQHIVRLILAHQVKARVPVVIDVEGYKQRRYDALRALALRVAEQVKARGRQFVLEPMPAYERRIVHLTLADHPDVTTESIGDGEVRKVVIVPKKQR